MVARRRGGSAASAHARLPSDSAPGLVPLRHPLPSRCQVDGQAILVDVRNKLKTVISFGALKGARSKVLRRVDAVHGFIYDCRHNQVGARA